ncbi:MAG TPA: hypothetical protein H9689_00200 [Firmicutes bacterium]|nr:hypothetical protein [Bacillota bacterium]
MMEYEIIREIFNSCSGNQMRDVFVDEAEIADVDAYVRGFLVGSSVSCERRDLPGGGVEYDVVTDGLRQRFSFTPL